MDFVRNILKAIGLYIGDINNNEGVSDSPEEFREMCSYFKGQEGHHLIYAEKYE